MRKHLPLLLLLAFLSSTLYAKTNGQNVVRGVIVNENREALVAATVFLQKDHESKEILAHTITDDNGYFFLAIDKGKYLLGVSYIGYLQDTIDIDLTTHSELNLDTIQLKENLNEIQSVMVQGEMVRVRTQPDGYSVNVQQLREKSNDALDLLRRIPNMRVKGENLEVIGKQDVIVKIGNVVQRVSSKEIGAVLKGYDAHLIERVEVLMQPPLRYDPTGNTAMIILHTSSFFKEYMGGVVGTELMLGEKNNNRYGGYSTLLYNRKKLFWSVSPSYNYNTSSSHEHTKYEYANRTYQNITPSSGAFDYMGARATMQYQYNTRGHIGVLAGINNKRLNNKFTSYDRHTPATATLFNVDNYNKYTSRKPKINATAYWEQTFGEHDNTTWLELSYYNFTERMNTDYEGLAEGKHAPYFTYQDRDKVNVAGWALNNDYSFRLDTEGNYTLDAGLKSLWTSTANNRQHSQWLQGSPADTYAQEGKITLSELWFTPYFSSTLRFSQKFWMRLGMRASLVARKMEGTSFNRPYTFQPSWLPSFHTSYNPTAKHRINFTLNASATQPDFDQLNPFEWRISSQLISRGNTELQPSQTYDANLRYVFNRILSFSAQFAYGRKQITRLSIVQNGIVYSQTENAQDNLYGGLRASYYFDKLEWMSFSLSSFYGRNVYTSQHPHLKARSISWEWGADAYIDFYWGKFTGYLSADFTGPRHTALSEREAEYSFEAGLSCALLQRRLYINLAGLNLISAPFKGHSERPNYTLTFNNRYTYPTLYFSVSYKFSNAKDNSTRRRMSTEDAERRF